MLQPGAARGQLGGWVVDVVTLGLGTERNFGRARFRTVTFVIGTALALLAVRLYVLQVRRHAEFQQKSESNFIQVRRVRHERGHMRDRDSRILVDNRPSHDVSLTPAFMPQTRTTLSLMLRRAGIDADAREVAKALPDLVARDRPPPLVVASGLTMRQSRGMEAQLGDLRLSGMELVEDGQGAQSLVLYPLEWPSVPLVYRRLKELLELTEEQLADLKKDVRKARGLNRFVPLIVRQNLPWDAYSRISHFASLGELPGVDVVESVVRQYREGSLAAHVFGYMNEVSGSELDQLARQGYQRGDYVGRRGLERSYESLLRGQDGQMKVVVDAKGRRINDGRVAALLGEERREAPTSGLTLVLTLDMDLQKTAETAFRGTAGAVVAVEVNTGSILAMASFPAYDPNVVSSRLTGEQKRALDSDPLQPWINKAVQQHYAPGSTFKVLTAVAGLLENKITPDTQLYCPGFFQLGRTRWRCFNRGGHGSLSLRKAVQVSCDSYFYRLGHMLGATPLAQRVRALGLGRRTGIPLDGEIPGIIADEDYYISRFGSYQGGYVVNNAIGQGDVAVTPLQLAMAYAAVINGGILFEPRLVLRAEDTAGRVVKLYPPKERVRVQLPERGLQDIILGMGDVVKPGGTASGVMWQDDPPGLGHWLRTSGVQMGGKTGTAQVVRLSKSVSHIDSDKQTYLLRDHAWFSGFAPLDKPEIVVVTLTEHGGFGGRTSAPVSAAVIRTYFEKKGFKAGAVPWVPRPKPAKPDEPEETVHEDGGE